MSKVDRVLLRAGLTSENLADFQVRELARSCLERCHYIDRAAEELGRVLRRRRFLSGKAGIVTDRANQPTSAGNCSCDFATISLVADGLTA